MKYLVTGDTVNLPPRPAEARETLADTDLFYSTFEWKPRDILEEWINAAMPEKVEKRYA
jgi:hypothetical protein